MHTHKSQPYKTLAQNAWSQRRWRQRDPRSGRQKRTLYHRRACARNEATRSRMERSSTRARQSFRRYRKQRLAERRAAASLTPYDCGSHGRFAVPCYVVACESGYNFRARNGVSTAGGAYQIIDSTWRAYGGTNYADSHPAAVAPKDEQHRIANRVLHGQGMSAWECA